MYVNETYLLSLHSSISSCGLMANMTLMQLAPWIMLLIALWGIWRVFRPGADSQARSPEDETDDSDTYTYDDAAYEDDDEYGDEGE